MTKKIKWYKGGSKASGHIYYKKHPTRKHGVNYDRYYRAEYQFKGKRIAINFGWESDGWTELKCLGKLKLYKENAKNGLKPTSLKEENTLREVKVKEQEKIEQKKTKERKTIGDFFKDVYAPAALKYKKEYTVQNEISLFNNWLASEIGHLPFNKIKPFNLEKVKKNMLDAGRAPRSLQYCFAVFRQIWNHARIDDLINEDSPTRKVKLPKVKNKRLRFFTHEEADKLLGALKIKSQQVHDMTLFSLHTGARAGELFSLTWGVVDLKNNTVLLRDSKGSDRHVYLTDATQTMLELMCQGQSPSDFIFKDRNGEQIKYISKTFDRTVKELGFNDGITDRRDKATFHTCRHTFASWHVQNGTDLYTVKNLLGHSTIQLTERYSHLRPDGLKKAARMFDEKIIKSNVVKLEKAENG